MNKLIKSKRKHKNLEKFCKQMHKYQQENKT